AVTQVDEALLQLFDVGAAHRRGRKGEGPLGSAAHSFAGFLRPGRRALKDEHRRHDERDPFGGDPFGPSSLHACVTPSPIVGALTYRGDVRKYALGQTHIPPRSAPYTCPRDGGGDRRNVANATRIAKG